MSNQKYKLVFLGTPDFAVPGLTALLVNPNFEVTAIITQEDKPVGRKQILTPPVIKTVALAAGKPVWQPSKIKTVAADLKDLAPDFIVVIAYGQILPPEILEIPKIACVNVHASLLPRYRGAACLQAPILNGDHETGVTVMLMEKGLDTGPILKQEKIELQGTESLEDLHNRLAALGAEILPQTLLALANNQITPQLQDNAKASYVKEIKKIDGLINWDQTAEAIERKIRAFRPWPGTFSYLNNKIIKIIRAQILEKDDQTLEIGEIFNYNGHLAIKCRQNAILILDLQLEGKNPIDSTAFLTGHKEIIGQKLVSSSNG